MHDKKEKPPRGRRDLLRVPFKHRSKVGVIFLATVLVVAVVVSFLIPLTYEARSSLMVTPGRDSREDAVATEIRIPSIRELIEKVLATLKVETVYPDLAASPPSATTPLQASLLAFGKNLTV